MPSPRAAAVIAALRQLDESQWWSPEVLLQHQHRQLKPLLKHAYSTVPYYRKRWKQLGGIPDPSSEAWLAVPLVTRAEIQQAGSELISEAIPPSHGRSHIIRTSGSLGMPISTLGTDVTRFFLDVITMRDHAWHHRNLREKLAIVRYVPDGNGKYPNAIDIKGWGCVAGEILETGPARLLHIFSPVADIAQWLNKENPNSLLIYPSVANELLRYSNGKRFNLPALHELRTVGEMVTPEMRQSCEQTWGAKLVDIYSANEIGYIALQCPEYPHYHIQSENILVEILDDAGHPCKAGDTGRVVITTLNNYATPLIRYEIGDLAVAGAECSCGRGLPVIKQILGRYRNLLTLPDGKRVFPQFGHQKYIAPIRQIQMIQTAPKELTIRLVMPRKMTTKERQGMTTILHDVLGYPFNLTYEYVETLRRSANGKLEEFISLL